METEREIPQKSFQSFLFSFTTVTDNLKLACSSVLLTKEVIAANLQLEIGASKPTSQLMVLFRKTIKKRDNEASTTTSFNLAYRSPLISQ